MVFAYEQFSRHLDLSHMITQANAYISTFNSRLENIDLPACGAKDVN